MLTRPRTMWLKWIFSAARMCAGNEIWMRVRATGHVKDSVSLSNGRTERGITPNPKGGGKLQKNKGMMSVMIQKVFSVNTRWQHLTFSENLPVLSKSCLTEKVCMHVG